MCYYTITTDLQDKNGQTQAIMIIDAKDEESAKQEYINTFNLTDCDIIEGIRIPDGFAGLLTEPIKRTLYKHATGRSNMPLVSYSNRVQLKYDEE
jgi:hypothetical protein